MEGVDKRCDARQERGTQFPKGRAPGVRVHKRKTANPTRSFALLSLTCNPGPVYITSPLVARLPGFHACCTTAGTFPSSPNPSSSPESNIYEPNERSKGVLPRLQPSCYSDFTASVNLLDIHDPQLQPTALRKTHRRNGTAVDEAVSVSVVTGPSQNISDPGVARIQ
ncbi:uncharacterized protein CLUP02_17509 [Colletotrichum lupini]|uniref:Uncharacterized protein n=1 Tax=Colletotrichum lupini TaxID=145971 RepID=A0A9Q8WAA7_9PEZI|nr:uncharacterized protein CLUP02_17509 [Colletotrichum lupini]UQC75999.1 hypothetical protein CLUP02_17509 [Colletotrichum lupini]